MKVQEEVITVIVAVYNIEAYLEKCVRTIMNQTYHNLQIILVDDGSTDSSGIICDHLAKEDVRIVVLHKKNGGLSDARNAGMELASGTYIAFVDGDDWIDENMYETMLECIRTYEADTAVCRYRCIYADHIKDESTGQITVFEGREALAVYIAEDETYQIQNAAWNKVYKRELITDQRFPKGKWYEDIVYTTKLLSKIKRCVYIDKALYNYVIDREGSIMNTGINPRVLTDQLPAYREKTAFLCSIGEEELANTHDYYVYKRMLIFYTQFRRSGDKRKNEYCKEIQNQILADKERFPQIYRARGANPNEKKKMDIFIKSPTLYFWVMLLNDKLVIPAKQKLQSIRKRGR